MATSNPFVGDKLYIYFLNSNSVILQISLSFRYPVIEYLNTK